MNAILGVARVGRLDRLSAWVNRRWHRFSRWPARGDERGDVPGWVMVTLMTAGLVVTLWAVAGPRLSEVFNDAMDRVVGGP
jgi:hypothetical protein